MPAPSIFLKVGDISMKILRRKNWEEDRANFDFVGSARGGDGLNTWTLLNNKTILSNYTCVAAEDTEVYFFKRNQFFEGLEIGLNNSRPVILEYIRRLPIFGQINLFHILRNIAQFEKVVYQYGKVIARPGPPADHAYILMDGNVIVQRTVPFQTISSISLQLYNSQDKKQRRVQKQKKIAITELSKPSLIGLKEVVFRSSMDRSFSVSSKTATLLRLSLETITQKLKISRLYFKCKEFKAHENWNKIHQKKQERVLNKYQNEVLGLGNMAVYELDHSKKMEVIKFGDLYALKFRKKKPKKVPVRGGYHWKKCDTENDGDINEDIKRTYDRKSDNYIAKVAYSNYVKIKNCKSKIFSKKKGN